MAISTGCKHGLVLLTAAALWCLAGCGSPPATGGATPAPDAAKPTGAPAEKPATPAAAAPKPADTPPGPAKDYSFEAQQPVHDFLVIVMDKSELWKAYFAYRASQPQAPKPLVHIKAVSTRAVDPRGDGIYKGGTVKMLFSVMDLQTNLPLFFEDGRVEALPSTVWSKGNPQDTAFRLAEQRLLHSLASEAALAAMTAKPDLAKTFAPQIAEAFRNGDRDKVRLMAANALFQHGLLPDDAPAELAKVACRTADVRDTLSQGFGDLLVKLGQKGVDALAVYCRPPVAAQRQRAAELLSRMGPPAVPILVEGLQEKSWPAYLERAEPLARMGADAAAACPALIEDLKQKLFLVREEAGKTLFKIGPAALPGLIEALGQDDQRLGAAQALGLFGPQAAAAVPALVQTLSGKNDDDTTTAVISTLGKIGGAAKPAVAALESLAKKQPRLARGVAAAVKKINEAAPADGVAPVIELPKEVKTPPKAKVVAVYKLKNGTEVRAVQAVDAGEEWMLKDEKGQFVKVAKTDIAEIKPAEGGSVPPPK